MEGVKALVDVSTRKRLLNKARLTDLNASSKTAREETRREREQYNVINVAKRNSRAAKVTRGNYDKNVSNGMDDTNNMNNTNKNKGHNGRARDKYIGIACHGAELNVSTQANPGEKPKYYRIRHLLPPNVKVLTVAAPQSSVSAHDTWFIKMFKEGSTEYIATLFEHSKEGDDAREALALGLMYGDHLASYIRINVYKDECPDMVLSSSTWDALLNPKTPCKDILYNRNSDWLPVPRARYVDAIELPVNHFLTRDAGSPRTMMNFIPRSELKGHPCATAVCKRFKTGDIRHVACMTELTHAFRQDLEEQRPLCKWAEMNPHEVVIPPRMGLGTGPAIQDASNYLHYRFQKNKAMSVSEYLFWRLNFSKQAVRAYGNKRLNGRYTNARFLLSDFIKAECTNPNKVYNIVVFSCRAAMQPFPISAKDLDRKKLEGMKPVLVREDTIKKDYNAIANARDREISIKRRDYHSALQKMTEGAPMKMINHKPNASNNNSGPASNEPENMNWTPTKMINHKPNPSNNNSAPASNEPENMNWRPY